MRRPSTAELKSNDMATLAVASAAPEPAPALRQQILDWYEKLPSLDHSQVLGVSPSAAPEALRSAFVALVRRFHPDALGRADAELRRKGQAILVRVTEAYRSLSVPSSLPPRSKRSASPPPAPQPAAVPVAPRSPVGASCPSVGPRRVEPPRPAAAPAPADPAQQVEAAIVDAEASLAAGDPEAAVIRLQQVLPEADRRQRRRIRLALARTYLSDGRWRHTGVNLLNDMLRDEPCDAEAASLLAALYRREGLLSRAEVLLARAALADPGNARARAELREVRLALQERRAAEARPVEGRGLLARLLPAR
jgi:hypothetical protein